LLAHRDADIDPQARLGVRHGFHLRHAHPAGGVAHTPPSGHAPHGTTRTVPLLRKFEWVRQIHPGSQPLSATTFVRVLQFALPLQ
jgi:hypothetical protein